MCNEKGPSKDAALPVRDSCRHSAHRLHISADWLSLRPGAGLLSLRAPGSTLRSDSEHASAGTARPHRGLSALSMMAKKKPAKGAAGGAGFEAPKQAAEAPKKAPYFFEAQGEAHEAQTSRISHSHTLTLSHLHTSDHGADRSPSSEFRRSRNSEDKGCGALPCSSHNFPPPPKVWMQWGSNIYSHVLAPGTDESSRWIDPRNPRVSQSECSV